MAKYQITLFVTIALAACLVTVMYFQHKTIDQEVEVVTLDKTSSTKITSTTQQPTTVEKFHKLVPLHVGKAISKLYREFKANGSITNDLIATPKTVIPNIYHYIRFNQPFMKFYEMLSMKSAIKMGRPEKIYLHTNTKLEGKFWDMIKNESSIQILHREPPKSIFGKPFGFIEHVADLARIQVLREYGGVYLDNDCIVLNEFEHLRKHHCVVSKSSHERWMGNMIMMASKDCVFLKMYEELYKLDYRKKEWYWNGGMLPQYTLVDQYPGLVYPANEGVREDIVQWLFRLDKPVAKFRKCWSIIHLFYRLRFRASKDKIEYDENNIKTYKNSYARIARWILYDHEDLMLKSRDNKDKIEYDENSIKTIHNSFTRIASG